MGIISCASGASCWRGLDYYKLRKIKNIKKISNTEYSSIVSGTEDYSVYLNLEKVRKSTCNCPLANGKRIICKHIVATYFAVVPNSAKDFEEEQNKLQEEYEEYQDELYDKVISYINKMSKKDLIEELVHVFDYGPEWLYHDFVKRNYIE
jgi:uncharacterized Zn finger protein